MQDILKLESIRIPRSGAKLSFDMIRNFRAIADDQNPANELVGVVYLETKNVEIYKEDANLLAKNINADVAYIDPPYNSRQYSRFYHLYENLIEWEKPELFGVAMKPKAKNMSAYCTSSAPTAFRDLIQKLNVKYIAVSYNNTYDSKSGSSKNKITLEQIQSILEERGTTYIYESEHKCFNTGKTEFENHKELLFITEVKQ